MSSSPSTHPFLVLFLILFSISSFSHASLRGEGEDGLVLWRRSVAEGSPLEQNITFILAEKRTRRPDPADGLKDYTGGWNISNPHYLSSVTYTAAPIFATGILWFLGFLLHMVIVCCCYKCCCGRKKSSYSSILYALSLILLIFFICGACVGRSILHTNTSKFQKSATSIVEYLVSKANSTAVNLRDLANNLENAKNVSVEQILLPGDVQSKIDVAEKKLKLVTNDLAEKTNNNTHRIDKALGDVRMKTDSVALVMIVLACLGLLSALFGIQFLVYLMAILAWVLLVIAFGMSGIFLIFHNMVGDTCVAMEEWLVQPQARTALDDILPCVDIKATSESLYWSKEVTFQLVNLVNKAISNLPNSDKQFAMPLLCNPYNSDISGRTCLAKEVDFNSASKVWNGYVCETTNIKGVETCTNNDGITPSMYDELTAAAKTSQGMYESTGFLIGLQNCTFVRDAFDYITKNECPGLNRSSEAIHVALIVITLSVLFALFSWVIHARQKHNRDQSKRRAGHAPMPL